MLNLKTYSINNNLTLTNEILVSYITNFWNDIFTNIKENSHLLIMCKIQFNDESASYRTLGHLRKVNFDDKDLFIEYLSQRLSILNDSYITLPVSNITFSYIIKEGLCDDQSRKLLSDFSDKSLPKHSFNNMVLPISMNPSDYGEIRVDNYIQINGESVHRFMVRNGNRMYNIDISNNGLTNHVTIEGAIDLQWIDTLISGTRIKREIKKSTIYFMDGVAVLRKQQLNNKYFQLLKAEKSLINNFYTLDIETIKMDNKLNPYLICAYNGKDYITSYNNNQKELFNSFFEQLLSKIKPGTKTLIYAHNLSNFDGIFLLRHLLSLGKVEPLIFNGKLMSIKVKIGSNKSEYKTIVFKDSYLLLPLSLRKLCAAFEIVLGKGYFPFLLNNIYYSGVLPKFEYWTGISLTEFKLFKTANKNKMWNFELEATKYCKLDCQCLHEVLTKFNKLIFNHFNINIHKALTLPALAMRIYKTHYMPENTICQLVGRVDVAIRNSYSGGAVDVYIPHNRITAFFNRTVKAAFKFLYYYDVNALYPFIMAKTLMPIGKPIVFDGDIRKIDPEAFGFFYCKINSPEYLEHPILQRRIKTADGVRTIAGLGTWEGWISSNEMDNAMKFGYTFEILNGYQFEKGDIFSAYINKMYNLRLEYEKGHPMNLTAKLLMNSLYGKFGMKLETTSIEMYDTSNELENELFHEMLEAYGQTVQDWIKIDNHFLTVRKSLANYKYNEDEDMYHGLDVNIAIASAITGGARIWMSVLKNSSIFRLFYSDTDSIIVDKPLPAFMVGTELGQFKL
jgi:hypothetical protein